METFTEINKTSLTNQIYKHLLNKIINNELPPGSRIIYDDLVKELGVSRTPLREAINKLNADRLITIKPRSGTFVKIPSKKDIIEVYDIRLYLESLSIELAYNSLNIDVLEKFLTDSYEAERALNKGDVAPFFRIDRKLHQSIIFYANNEFLTQFWKVIESQIQWYGVIMTTNSARPHKANKQHIDIINFLINEDLVAARELMSTHIKDMKENMLHNNLNTFL